MIKSVLGNLEADNVESENVEREVSLVLSSGTKKGRAVAEEEDEWGEC